MNTTANAMQTISMGDKMVVRRETFASTSRS